jgi:hypothetical protein
MEYKYDILTFLYLCSLKNIKTLTLEQIKTVLPEDSKYVKQMLHYLLRKKLIDTLGHRKQYKYFVTAKGIDEVKRYYEKCYNEGTSDIIELILQQEENSKCHN